MRPPPPVPTDSGSPLDSWYMFPAMPAAALWEYPWASRKVTIAVTFAGSMPMAVLQVSVAARDAVAAGEGFAAGAFWVAAGCLAAALLAAPDSACRVAVMLSASALEKV